MLRIIAGLLFAMVLAICTPFPPAANAGTMDETGTLFLRRAPNNFRSSWKSIARSWVDVMKPS